MPRSIAALSVSLALLAGCSCALSHEPAEGDASSPLGEDAGTARDAADPGDATDAAVDAGPIRIEACGTLGTQSVAAAALSPSGARYAYSAFAVVTLLDARSGRVLRELGTGVGRTGRAHAIAFSPDERRLFLGNTDRIRVLSVPDGRVLHEISVPRLACCGLTEVAFAPAAGIAVAEGDGLQVVDLETGVARALRPEVEWTRNFSLSPDGTLLAIAQGESVAIVRVEDGAVLRSLPLRADVFTSPILFSPDGTLVAIVRSDRSAATTTLVEIARTDGTGEVARLGDRAPQGLIFAGTWSPDGTRLWIARNEGEIAEVAVSRAPLALSLTARRAMPLGTAVALSADAEGRLVGGAAHVFALEPDGALAWMRAGSFGDAGSHALQVDVEGRVLASGVLWDRESGLAERVLDAARARAALGRDGRSSVRFEDGTLVVEGERAGTYAAPFAPDAIALDGETIAIASDTELAVIDRASGEVTARLSRGSEGGRAVLVERSPDGRHVAVGTLHGPLRVLELATGDDVTPAGIEIGREVRGSGAAAFLPDGRVASVLYLSPSLRVDVVGGEGREVAAVGLPRAIAIGGGGHVVVDTLDGVSLLDGELAVGASLERTPTFSRLPSIGIAPDGTLIARTAGELVELLCARGRG